MMRQGFFPFVLILFFMLAFGCGESDGSGTDGDGGPDGDGQSDGDENNLCLNAGVYEPRFPESQ